MSDEGADAGVNLAPVRGLLNVLSPTHPKQLIPRIPIAALFVLSFTRRGIYIYSFFFNFYSIYFVAFAFTFLLL